ncbi:MAG: hypothetical protein J6A59_15960 [Lachnospiraceae bacterium]|nr:hypothetical protein [Lachnospiraceae bacterium]
MKNTKKYKIIKIVIIVCALLLILYYVMLKISEYREDERQAEYRAEQMLQAKRERANSIISLDVTSAVVNDDYTYRVNYPNYISGFKNRNGNNDLVNAIEPENITPEDFEYIVEYVNGIPSDMGENWRKGAFRVYIRYYDENGNECSRYVTGYEEFPKGWSEFIDMVNYISGDEYLHSEGEIVEVTPEYLSEVCGVTDADVNGGTLKDFIEYEKLNLLKLVDGFSISLELDRYYTDLNESFVEPYRPLSVELVDSTVEEYDEFIKEFLSVLGGEWQEGESNQDHLRYFYNEFTDEEFYLGRSENLKKMNIYQPNNSTEKYCKIQLDLHMENMYHEADFYYSQNKKFILVDTKSYVDNTELILKFIDIK